MRMDTLKRALWIIPYLAAAAVFLTTLVVTPSNTNAQGMADWAGSWYSETKEDGQVNNKKYSIRKQLAVNRADGTKVNIFRFYSGARLVAEDVITYRWGVDKDLYWTICQTVLTDGKASPCDARIEYEVIAVSRQQLRYKSKKTGISYSSDRVADTFKLP